MSRPLALSRRDHELVRCAWSLGWATSDALRDAVSPETLVKTLSRRLGGLVAAGYLRRRRIIGGVGHIFLYGAGRNAPTLDPAYRDAWRPSDAQVLHTLAVGETLAALLVPGVLGSLAVTGWEGEAELRQWHEPGAALPDLRVRWSQGERSGAWPVEVDRGTEGRAAWRRKLTRYVHTSYREILVVTTSDERARNLARIARELGAPAITTDLRALRSGSPVFVYDSIRGCRRLVDG
jgi:hypothetical protein